MDLTGDEFEALHALHAKDMAADHTLDVELMSLAGQNDAVGIRSRHRTDRLAHPTAEDLQGTTWLCQDAIMPRDPGTVIKYVLAALALAAMLALAPFFLASGLMAPGWAVALFIVIWLALFVVGCLWIRRKPLWVIPLPFVAAAIWFGGMSAGGAWLGWTP